MAENDNIVVDIQLKATDHASPEVAAVAKAFKHAGVAADHAKEATQHASASIGHAGAAAHVASGHTGVLGNAFHHLKQHAVGIAVSVTGLSLGFASLAEKAFESNKELGSIQKQVAQVNNAFQSWNKTMSSSERVVAAKKEAKEVTEAFEGIEERLAVPMQTLGDIYRTVGGKAFQKLHLGQEEVIALTTKAAEASKVFGVSGEQAANSIAKALQTGVVPRGLDPFNDKLHLILDGTKKLHLNSQQTYKAMMKGLGDLGPAADEFSKGMGDQLFRIRDIFEDTLRDTAMPLFKHVIELVKTWQTKLAASGTTMKDLAERWGHKLVTVFDGVAKAIGFVSDHWKELAGAWLAFKVPAGIAAVAGMFSGGGGAMSGLTKGLSGGAGFNGFLGSLGTATAGLALFHTALQAAASMLDEWQTKKIEGVRKADNLGQFGMHMGAISKLQKGLGEHTQDSAWKPGTPWASDDAKNRAEIDRRMISAAHELEAQGIIKDGKVVEGAFATMVSGLTDESRKLFFKDLPGSGKDQEMAALQIFKDLLAPVSEKGKGVHDNAIKPAVVMTGDIHITQDFKDQDPDRVWISFKNGMENLAGNKLGSNLTQAHE